MELTVRERARMERVRILLKTRNDVYPGPRSLSIPSSPSGPAPGRFVRCAVCGGLGRVRISQICPGCDGRKRIAIDSYTGRVTDESDRKPQPMSPERIEAELRRLSTSLKLSEGCVDPEEQYGWERARKARDRQGSYRELERALERLRARDPDGVSFLAWIYDTGLDVELSTGARLVEERYIHQLASMMPAKVKLPKHLAVELSKQKEELIEELQFDNLSEEEIADRALVSVATVRKVLGTLGDVTKSQSTAKVEA